MKNIFDRYYKRYDAWYDNNRFIYLSELEAIRKVLPKKGKGLEIGVGTGRFALPLGITSGVDLSKNMIKLARKRGIDARLGSGERLSFKSGVFSYVTIIITLSFVQNPQKVLEEARRVLKKNGKVIIGIIDKDSFLARSYRRRKGIFYKKANFFSVSELTELLKLLDFRRFSYYQTICRSPGKMASIERPIRGFGKGGFVVIRAEKQGGGSND